MKRKYYVLYRFWVFNSIVLETTFKIENQVDLATFFCHSDRIKVNQVASALHLIALIINFHKWVLIKLNTNLLEVSIDLAAQQVHGEAGFVGSGAHEANIGRKALARQQLGEFEVHLQLTAEAVVKLLEKLFNDCWFIEAKAKDLLVLADQNDCWVPD